MLSKRTFLDNGAPCGHFKRCMRRIVPRSSWIGAVLCKATVEQASSTMKPTVRRFPGATRVAVQELIDDDTKSVPLERPSLQRPRYAWVPLWVRLTRVLGIFSWAVWSPSFGQSWLIVRVQYSTVQYTVSAPPGAQNFQSSFLLGYGKYLLDSTVPETLLHN